MSSAIQSAVIFELEGVLTEDLDCPGSMLASGFVRSRVSIRPGAVEVLQKLKELGLGTAVLSNQRVTSTTELILRSAGLLPFVDVVRGLDERPQTLDSVALQLGLSPLECTWITTSETVADSMRTLRVDGPFQVDLQILPILADRSRAA